MIEYHVVLPFIRNAAGGLVAEEPLEERTAPAAIAKARGMAPRKAGVIAFSRKGEPATGDYAPAVELVRLGEVPDDLD